MSTFITVYYDSWKNKMHLWELDDNGNPNHLILDHELEYYVLDKTGTSNITSEFGEPVVRKVAKNRQAIEQLKESGERVFESDIKQTVKFLQKRYEGQEIKVDIKKYNIFNVDIETEWPESETINLIGIEDYHTGEVFQLGLKPYTGDNKQIKYAHCKTEVELLETFCRFLKLKNVQVVYGWNILHYDFPKIQERIDTLRLKCSMSPIGKVIRKFDDTVEIVGIEQLDSMELYKKFTFKNQPSFSLNAIGKLEVNDQKIDYEGSILSFWKSDWNAFCDYNCQDLKLVTKIEMKKKLIPLAIGMGTDSRIQFSDVVSPIAVTEGDLLKEMHENNMVMEDITHNIPFEKTRSIIGGHVESYPGFYNYQCSIDCTSMYPHNTMMYNISKETKVMNPTEDQIPFLIKSHIPGVYYKKGQGLLPKITKKSFDKRKHYKKLMFQEKSNGNYDLAEYYDSQQLIQKIKINAFFGASANPHFHFYDFDNASQITAAGRDGIQYVSQNINRFLKDFHIIAKEHYPNYKQVTMLDKKTYLSTIDTDSVYFSLEHIYKSIGNDMSYLDFVLDFEKRILEPFLKKIMDEYAARYNTENLLHFKREKIILKSLVQAKKKYACLSIANEDEIYKDGPKLSVTGIETKKSDLCSFSRKNLNSLLELAFEGDRPDKQKMLKFVRDNYVEFLNQPITELAIPKGIGSMEKYESDISIDNKNFVTRTPIFNRASMVYNLVIKQNNFPYVEIKTGSKMKYVFVKSNNKYKTDVIGFIGTWPKEFDKLFKIDFDEQFDKQYLNVAQRLFDAIGLGLITLKDSKLLSLIEED